MGTNYYLDEQCCPTCNRPTHRLHIGKSSYGWTFALHIHPEHDLNSLEQWIIRWSAPGSRILDEYTDPLSPAHMLDIIENPTPAASRDKLTPRWYDENHAVPGPTGLVRRRIDGVHCVGHADGPWDYMKGNFS